jgi:ABC-type oligopeptide transport system substrate-binding subunit
VADTLIDAAGWRRARRLVLLLGALAAGLGLVALLAAGPSGAVPGGDQGEVSILGVRPATYDPAAQSDVTGAAVAAQLFEGLTAFDSSLTLQPALARTWTVSDAGRTVVFQLRAGLTFSDGSPITGFDVVRSWLRLIDPARPSPLASLLSGVVGADDYRTGRLRDSSAVGLSADGGSVTVRLRSPGADFPAIVAAGPFAVVPPGVADGSALAAGRFVGSGGYVLAEEAAGRLTLRANSRYWAGTPTIETVRIVTDLGGRSPVSAFESGTVDYAPIGPYDAAWIRYDADLGPQLRAVRSLAVEYLGFDASRAPFDDRRVRQAIAAAVDWRRIVDLAGPGDQVPATGMIPPGISGRSSTEFRPAYAPDRARSLLAEAGFPGGEGFPEVAIGTGGTAYGEAIRAAIQTALGIRVGYETMVSDDYYARLTSDPPPIWTLGWVADYPAPNDFLGVLLGSDSVNNVGRWRNAAFDAAIADAGTAVDAGTASAAFERAQAIVRDEVPVIPLAYSDGWALSRHGLRGAGDNGLGVLRFAGLAWAD